MKSNIGVVLVTSALIAAISAPALAQPYSAQRNGDIIRLEDAGSGTVVSIVPGVGDVAFEMQVRGQDVLRWPSASVEDFKARPTLSGIPFLGPWANRLDQQAFYANGRKYAFDMELGNVRGAIPIHGCLSTTDLWEGIEVNPDATPLRDHNLDDVFGDLVRDGEGRAVVSVAGQRQRLDIMVGPNFRSVVVWAPRSADFICLEPMAGITDAVNLAHQGV